MKKRSFFPTQLLPVTIAIMLAAGCEQTGSKEEDKFELLESFFSTVGVSTLLNSAQSNFTIKIVNARANRSRPSAVNEKQYIYMQTDKAFLVPRKKTSVIPAQSTKCLDTDYADTVETDSAGNAVYTFTANQEKSIRIYFSIGDAIPESSIEHSLQDNNMRNIRFDWVEMTLDGSPTACVNLTSLEQLGICMSLKAQHDSDDSNASTFGWNKSFNDIVAETKSTALQYDEDDPARICRIVGAQQHPELWTAASLTSALNGKSIIMTGSFNGTDKTPDHGKAGFRFTGTFTNGGADITLSGNFYESSTPLPTTMTVTGLVADAIYAADPKLCASVSHGTGANGGGYDHDQSATENDRWAKLFGLLVGGINTGLWNAEPNNLRWTSDKAYSDATTCNPYSRMIREYSNSYGDPYSDLTENVLLNLYKTKDGKQTVNTLVITLLDDGATGGYTERTPKTHMDLASLKISLPPPSLLKLTQIDYKQGGSLVGSDIIDVTSTIGIDAQFPAAIEFGTPFDMIFHFSNYTGSEVPSVTVTLPVDVFAAPDPGKIVIPSCWNVTDGLCQWNPIVYVGPYVNLVLGGILNAGNLK